MSMTIPRRIRPRRGDYRAMCDLCGMTWMRSDLFRDEDGFLRCPDDADGEATATLMRGNAEGAGDAVAHRPYGDTW